VHIDDHLFADGELSRIVWTLGGGLGLAGALFAAVFHGRRRQVRRLTQPLQALAPRLDGEVLEGKPAPRMRFKVDDLHGTLSFTWSNRPGSLSRDETQEMPSTHVEIRLPREVSFEFKGAVADITPACEPSIRAPLERACAVSWTPDITVRATAGRLVLQKLSWIYDPEQLEALIRAGVALGIALSAADAPRSG